MPTHGPARCEALTVCFAAYGMRSANGGTATWRLSSSIAERPAIATERTVRERAFKIGVLARSPGRVDAFGVRTSIAWGRRYVSQHRAAGREPMSHHVFGSASNGRGENGGPRSRWREPIPTSATCTLCALRRSGFATAWSLQETSESRGRGPCCLGSRNCRTQSVAGTTDTCFVT